MSDLKNDKKVRCVVVDDSTIYRNVVRNVLTSIPNVEVIGVANDGIAALSRIELLKPDLITLDLEMPNLDGIGVLRELAKRKISVTSILLSGCNPWGAHATNTALQLGAFDFVTKPNTNSPEESIQQLKNNLTPRIKAFLEQRFNGEKKTHSPPKHISSGSDGKPHAVSRQEICQPSLVVIGSSTGGPQALTQLLTKIPGNFPVPILITQHMPPIFTKSLADDLDSRCELTIHEASQNQPIKAGNVYIAPGGKQMRLSGSSRSFKIEITDDPPQKNCRPSVDYLFESAAKNFGNQTLGVVLTGMGDDGSLGARMIKEAGGSIFAQNASSCVVYGMPKSVVDLDLADRIIPLNKMAATLTLSVQGKRAVLV